MGNMIIRYTPPDDTLKTITFPASNPKPKLYRGGLQGVGARNFFPSGANLTVIHEQFFLFRIQVQAIKPRAGEALWGDLYTFWQDALRGVAFEIAMDADKSSKLTLNGSHAAGVTTLTVNEAANASPRLVEDGDRMRIEDATLDTKREFVVVKVGTATTIPIYGSGTHKQLDAVSEVFFDDHYPICKAAQLNEPLKRRDGSRGAALWDFELSFRTTAS